MNKNHSENAQKFLNYGKIVFEKFVFEQKFLRIASELWCRRVACENGDCSSTNM